MTPERFMIKAAFALANRLPSQTVEAVADAILTPSHRSLEAEISKRVPHHQHRDLALAFVTCWKNEASGLGAQAVATALYSAAFSEETQRQSQSVELVWTGPDIGQMPFRRTEQAILQILDGAKQRITLVSYAVYKIPNVGRALVQAAKRGVQLTVIVETPDLIEGQSEYSTIRALGEEVVACSSVYYWPRENRRCSESGKVGILHVKCVVVDGEWLFVSSANLTQQAFTINMELGVLFREEGRPGQVEEQFRLLIDCGQLKKL